ncbi:MAG: SLBB domain-containing protein [Desulfobacterales bacterium]|nr:SLBB domain-containing protein [Desulfobacterales bacterium]
MQTLKNLSPSERQEILRRLSPSQRKAMEQKLLEFPSAMEAMEAAPGTAAAEPVRVPEEPEKEEKIRAQGGDTLVVKIGLRDFVPGEQTAESAFQGEKKEGLPKTWYEQRRAQIESQSRSKRAKSKSWMAEEETGPVAERVFDLLGVNVFRLDKDGILVIPGVNEFFLAGLTEEEIALRLSADPMLKDLVIFVTIVPERPETARMIEPFGYDIFEGVPTTFAPATDIPMPADYLIGPGDTIHLQLFGKTNAEYTLVVSRDGTVQIPEIGPKTVAGLNFSELQDRVKNYVENQMIGVRASITMGRLRSIRIFVLGDVNQSGSYTVSALSTMTNALFVSGGVKRPLGSLRDIQLKRDGKLMTRLDLYDLLLRGDTRNDSRLMPGDVLFVPPVKKTVGIAGAVRRPAIYEIKNEKTLRELIDLAGGLLPTAYKERAQLERISVDGTRVMVNVSLTDSADLDLTLADGDVLHIRPVLERLENTVRLAGHVERPGKYQWHEGMRLNDLITGLEADLKPRADLDYVLIKRELPPDWRIEILSARLSRALEVPDSLDNVRLMPRDEVRVFSLIENRAETLQPVIDQLRRQARIDDPERVVSAVGLVAFPGQYPLENDMRISDLVRAAGSLKQQAYKLSAELVRYQVFEGKIRETMRLPVELSAALAGSEKEDQLLRPFDALHIKQIPDWAEQRQVEIEGEVLFPGTYIVGKDETLLDLIDRAGGFNERAFLEGVVFTREELQQKEQRQLDRLRDQLRADLAAISLEQAQQDPQKKEALSMAQGLVQQLESTRAVGRLVIDLPAIVYGVAPDIILQDQDRIIIPNKPQEVTVLGEVNYPTSHVFVTDLSRDDYIERSGGLSYKADKGRVYVIRANGQVIGASTSWFSMDKKTDIRVGDTIVVPLNVDRMRPLYFWNSVSQIVYQLSLSIAAANAVGVF